MTDESQKDFTRFLNSLGDADSAAEIAPIVYDELRKMARFYMRGQAAGHTLQTTALIHEAFLKLADGADRRFENRKHFYAVAATAMRHILVDHARSKNAEKRGGAVVMVSLESAAHVTVERAAEMIALDEAINNLHRHDERKARVVVMRYFGGLSIEETAEILEISAETVRRDWNFARTWLRREMSSGVNPDQSRPKR